MNSYRILWGLPDNILTSFSVSSFKKNITDFEFSYQLLFYIILCRPSALSLLLCWVKSPIKYEITVIDDFLCPMGYFGPIWQLAFGRALSILFPVSFPIPSINIIVMNSVICLVFFCESVWVISTTPQLRTGFVANIDVHYCHFTLV